MLNSTSGRAPAAVSGLALSPRAHQYASPTSSAPQRHNHQSTPSILVVAPRHSSSDIVITVKHHDGFALFKSAASKYNVVDATPYKRDILKELADACARHGMRLGFYYSQSQDWHEPERRGQQLGLRPRHRTDEDELKKYDDYLRGKAEPQVKELLTNYGPVALIWFDTPRMMTPERGQRFADIVRPLQPNTLIDGRLGTEGDYRSTGDNVIPPEASERGVGNAGDDQRHVGLPQGRHQLEVARPDRRSSSSTSSARAATTC